MHRRIINSETVFDREGLTQHIQRLEGDIAQDSFWTHNANPQAVFRQLNQAKAKLETILALDRRFDDVTVLAQLLEEEPTNSELNTEMEQELAAFKTQLDTLETATLLSGEHDQHPCVFSLNAGAGGTDAQDWTLMLYRMYTRYFEQAGFAYEVVDESPGEEAGLKSATLLVSGPFCYGKLKNEKGVHRLVRLSPFNSSNKRQTSFAAVDVVPQLEADSGDIELDMKDIRVDTYRSSGAGGQHVNKTDSAVRVTHIPTGLVAQSQGSRSQTANKETALTILKSRIRALMIENQKKSFEELRGVISDIGWGHQIRSYVFHPYKLVKDLRTELETSDVSGVMDGDIDPFIQAHLRYKSEMEV